MTTLAGRARTARPDWRTPVFLLGIALAAGAVLSPLDRLGADGLLTAHLAQHIVLGDLAAPLLLLGLPVVLQRRLGGALARLAASTDPLARATTLLVSPVGAFVAWTAVTYVWFVPAVHRLAVPPGIVHLLDHLSFLSFGLVIWLGAFDPRPRRSLRHGLRLGGLPWWARHIYAMVTRLSMLPPAFAVWLAATSAYYVDAGPLPFGDSRAVDQVRAASAMIGFEMLLFSLAFVLAFIFAIVSEGHERSRAEVGRPR